VADHQLRTTYFRPAAAAAGGGGCEGEDQQKPMGKNGGFGVGGPLGAMGLLANNILLRALLVTATYKDLQRPQKYVAKIQHGFQSEKAVKQHCGSYAMAMGQKEMVRA
jgi:hypothetical protein